MRTKWAFPQRAGESLALISIYLGCSGHAATFTVTTAANDGAGSLRQSIIDANAAPGQDIIVFNIGTGGPQTITIAGDLPEITDPVVLEGTTQPGYAKTPLITLDGNKGQARTCLRVSAGNTTVRGLAITGFGSSSFPGPAIILNTNGGNRVAGCYIGVTTNGTARNNRGDGVFIDNCASNLIGGITEIDRNVISANSGNGILIASAQASNNIVRGNYIGLDPSGALPLANNVNRMGKGGITISNAPNNLIGGAVAGARNVAFDDKVNNAIMITGSSSTGNVVSGNYIGTTAAGGSFPTAPVSPMTGVRLEAPSNLIGGVEPGAGNVIGWLYYGIQILDTNASNNVVQGNLIGTDPSGTQIVSNWTGINILHADGNLIGGTTATARNIISGCGRYGVYATGVGNRFQGNFIGTDITGQRALGNSTWLNGAAVSLFGANNIVGGTTQGAANIISGNNYSGIDILGQDTSGNLTVNTVVQGNRIGVAADGFTPLGNAGRGIVLLAGSDNTLGGAAPGAGNLIGHNGMEGIWLANLFGQFGGSGSNNLVQANTIYSNSGPGIIVLGKNYLLANSIYGNAGLAIDVNGDGATANAPGSSNNAPVLESAEVVTPSSNATNVVLRAAAPQNAPTSELDLKLRLDAAPLGNYNLEIFGNPPQDDNPQAHVFLGRGTIQTDASGTGRSEFVFPFPGTIILPPGSTITANTSPLPEDKQAWHYPSELSIPLLMINSGTPDLSIGLNRQTIFSELHKVGDYVHVQVFATNAGKATAKQIDLSLQVHSSLSVIEVIAPDATSKEQYSIDDGTFIKCRFPDLAPGTSETFRVNVRAVKTSTGQKLLFTAKVSSLTDGHLYTDESYFLSIYPVGSPEAEYEFNGRNIILRMPDVPGSQFEWTTKLSPPNWQPVPTIDITNNDDHVIYYLPLNPKMPSKYVRGVILPPPGLGGH